MNGAARSRPAPAPQPPAAGSATRGWLSDLLRRASHEEETVEIEDDEASEPEAPVMSPVIERSQSLEQLATEISRAIDEEAYADLWQRHRRGERNVFTRRLYTLKGQQTFDQIRRKYQRDEGFRTAVDRYVDEFERLLSDIEPNDRDGVRGQAYLASETGKIYTVLAHASNRLN
ncbi:hypothetical protein [Segnochrobactrum spirostomi]|uniref:Uncharacterized protein n=1 Tax=Segnochrobactrum spirostomi TaxID=2608987 RepID=A0A6A7Y6X7_9HYPH|nr:hypothetical protein [Segnochrobactrum spirostomi]MQT14455.1 hypothetical protein [Segnochrobactrum spirostomi]